MTRLLTVGRPFGISIGLHSGWFVVALLLFLSMMDRLSESRPGWGGVVAATTCALAALLFLLGVLWHEVAHAAVARLRRIEVRSVALYAVGGSAEISGRAGDAAGEFWMGLAGPLASLVVGGLCLGAAHAEGWALWTEPATPALTVLVWTGYTNASLALFSFVPAFPMDGALVLRALLGRMGGAVVAATRRTARGGQAAALGFVVIGTAGFLRGLALEGLWLAVAGWFLWSTASVNHRRAALAERLHGVTVGDVMRREAFAVDARTNLEGLAEQDLLPRGGDCFVVWEGGALAGRVGGEDRAEGRPRRR